MKWISCEEKLPSKDELVLVAYRYYNNYCIEIMSLYFGDGIENSIWIDYNDKKVVGNVYYWMKLPSPP